MLMKKVFLMAVLSVFALAVCAQSWESSVKVYGTKITSSNVDNISSLFKGDLKAGTITYDYPSNTLTLDGVKIERGEAGWMFAFTCEDLRDAYIVIKGTNVIENTTSKGSSGTAFGLDNGITVFVDGASKDATKDTLRIQNGGTDFVGDRYDSYGNSNKLRIRNLSIISYDVVNSLTGNNDEKLLDLDLEKCYVRSYVSGSVLTKLASLNLKDCKFSKPANAAFNETTHQVEANGEAPKLVEITVGKAQAINQVDATMSTSAKIVKDGVMYFNRGGRLFTVQGQEVK